MLLKVLKKETFTQALFMPDTSTPRSYIINAIRLMRSKLYVTLRHNSEIQNALFPKEMLYSAGKLQTNKHLVPLRSYAC